MVHGAADISMRNYDPRRFGPYASKDWQVIKAHEDYKLRHEIPFPHFNRLQGRPVHPSPLYERLKSAGAVYEEVFGFERPRWFARGGIEQRDYYSFKRNELHDVLAAEVDAVRNRVGIMDVTAFTKSEVSGPDAANFLDRLVANKIPGKPGGIILTHFLNRRGRMELEATIARLSEDTFYIVCAAFFEQRLMDHLRHHQGGEEITIRSHSQSRAALTINGPKSRDVLAACTDAKLDNASFKWLSVQTIKVSGVELWAFRMSYAGELGWELHGPWGDMLTVYDALWEAGQAYGIENYGSFAMNILRMEKMFPGAGELTNEVTLPEAGVMRFVKLDKSFLGKTGTEASLATNRKWVCAYLEIEPDGINDGHGGEAVLHDGNVAGSTASVVYSYTIGKILAFAYIKPSAAAPGTRLQVVIACEERPAIALGEAAYDPQNLKPRVDILP